MTQSDAPLDSEPLPLSCPECGKPLEPRQDDFGGLVYACEQDGLFSMDKMGVLRGHGRLLRFPTKP